MKKSFNHKNILGFTLIEIIIVVIVLAILASLSLPRLTKMIDNHKAKQGVKILYDLYSAQKRFASDNNNAYTSDFAQLDIVVKNPPLAGYTLALPGTSTSLAEFARTSNPYTLSINDSGTISCAPSGPGSTCSQLSY